MIGRGIARAAVIEKRIDAPESPEARVTVGISGAAVEWISAFGPGSQRIASVAVSQMITEAKALEARVESGWAVAERAEAARETTGAVVHVALFDLGFIVVGHGR